MTIHLNKTTKNQRGFTLIEILVAMFLFALSVIAATSIIVLIQNTQRKSVYYSASINRVKSEIAKQKTVGYESLERGQTYPLTNLPDSLPNGSSGTISVASVSPVNSPDSKEIVVTITYPVGAINNKVSMTGYINSSGSY